MKCYRRIEVCKEISENLIVLKKCADFLTTFEMCGILLSVDRRVRY